MTDTHELNLTTHRASNSVWERSGWDGNRPPVGIPRLLIGIGGGALMWQGLRQRTALGSVLAGVGSGLAWWALAGTSDLSDARRWVQQAAERAGWRTDDRVHDESAESFPASDAPSWTPTVGTGLSSRVR